MGTTCGGGFSSQKGQQWGKRVDVLTSSCLFLFFFAAAANIEFFLPLGCFKDNANRPDMNEHRADIPDSTVNKDWCARACNNLGHPYGGLQMATKCFCGDEYAKYGFSNSKWRIMSIEPSQITGHFDCFPKVCQNYHELPKRHIIVT